MNDLQNRARDLMTHAASLGLEVMKACNEMETPELDETEEVAE